MEAAPVRLSQYFDGAKQNVVPLFQRPYSWGIDEWKVLWEDLATTAEDLSPIGHFMGTIVSMPVNSVPVGVSKFLIIDGQQRLTTLAILVAALRSAMTDKRRIGLATDLLVNNRYEGEPDELKVLPTQGDRASFSSVILGDVAAERTAGEQGPAAAYRFFVSQIKALPAGDADRYFDALQQKLQVVMINLGEADDPYLIFESLNAKGRVLDPTDLVRNFILMRFKHSVGQGSEQEAAYEEHWRPMERELEKDLGSFLLHYAQTGGDDSVKKGFYPAYKKIVVEAGKEGRLIPMLADMRRHARLYKFLLHPERALSAHLRQSLKMLQDLRQGTPYPLMLRLLADHDDGRINDEQLEKIARAVTSAVLRRAICEVPTNILNRLFAKICRTYEGEGGAVSVPRLLAQGQWREWIPRDEEVCEAILRSPKYRLPVLRPLLGQVELASEQKESPNLDQVSVEHVMPQTLTDEWRTSLGDRADDLHREYVHRLGNLTLSGYNSELSNEPFERKRVLLAQSNIAENKLIAREATWGPAQIDARGRRLAGIICRDWPLAAG